MTTEREVERNREREGEKAQGSDPCAVCGDTNTHDKDKYPATMKLSVSAYRAHASAHKKILSSSYQTQFNYGSTTASHLTAGASSTPHQPAPGLFAVSSPLYTAPLHQLQTRNQAPTHPQCVTIYIEPCLSIYIPSCTVLPVL